MKPPGSAGGSESKCNNGCHAEVEPILPVCNSRCQTIDKSLAQSTASTLRSLASTNVQSLLDIFATCQSIDCIASEYWSWLSGGAQVGAVIGAFIGLIIGAAFGPGGAAAAAGLGAGLGSAIGGFVGLLVGGIALTGLRAYESSAQSMLGDLQSWLNSSASTFDDQQISVQGLNDQWRDLEESREAFIDSDMQNGMPSWDQINVFTIKIVNLASDLMLNTNAAEFYEMSIDA